MGKGRIVSGGTDGLYTVELLHNRERIQAEIEFLTTKLAELQTELDALELERDGFVAERNAIATEIDTAIANAEEGEIPDVEALLVELAQMSARIQAQDVRIGMIQGRMLEARKRKEMLEAVPADPVQQAWCADFTEDLAGEVATVEVPAEGVVGQFLTWRRAQIRPGYAGRSNYSAARDGQMFHRDGQVGYQAYFNAAILPGVQRWRPQYRVGVIDSINRAADTCTLTIQGEDSSAQALLIDPPDLQYTKAGVPIEYMNCDSVAFEVGDRVLVEFTGRDWDQPKVIGFESNPRPCLLYQIFEVVIERSLSGQTGFGPSTADPDTCPSEATDVWYSGLNFWARVLDFAVDPLVRCEVDRGATNYEGACSEWSGNFSMPETLLASRNDLGNENINVFGAYIDGSTATPIEVDGFNLFQQIDVQYRTKGITKLYRPSGFGILYACTSPDEANVVLVASESVTVATLPSISFDGYGWDALGFVRVSTDAWTFRPSVSRLSMKVRVLCKRGEPI